METLSQLGQGTFGAVYKVKINEKYKALKFVKRSDDNIYNLPEIDSMSKLNHPNIIKLESLIFDQEVKGKFKTIYGIGLLIELLDGDTNLAIKLMETYEEKLSYSIEIIDALSFMHSVGCLHLDIKPENILFKKETTGKLTPIISDLGSIKYVRDVNISNKHNNQCGNSIYTPPEAIQDRGFQDYLVSGYTDIWQFGITLSVIMGIDFYEAKGEMIYKKDDMIKLKEKMLEVFDKKNMKRLRKEHNLPKALFRIFKSIFRIDPLTRISFVTLKEYLNDVYEIEEGMIIYPEINKPNESNYKNIKLLIDTVVKYIKSSHIKISISTLFHAIELVYRYAYFIEDYSLKKIKEIAATIMFISYKFDTTINIKPMLAKLHNWTKDNTINLKKITEIERHITLSLNCVVYINYIYDSCGKSTANELKKIYKNVLMNPEEYYNYVCEENVYDCNENENISVDNFLGN